MLGGVYVAKKVWESDLLAEMKRVTYGSGSAGEYSSHEVNLQQARKNFIFDVHQQSCDKLLHNLVADVRTLLQRRFDTEHLVERLKNEELLSEEKIHIWEELKSRTIGRILAVGYCYSLLVVALKTQRSILCQETCKGLERPKSRESGLTGGLIAYASSFFNKPQDEIQSNSNSANTVSDPFTQQLFSNCIHYLTSEGINQLFNRIELATNEILATIPLTREFTPTQMGQLMEKIKLRMEIHASSRNFSDLVVPISRPMVSSLADRSAHLQSLLTQLVNALQSQRCRTLLSTSVQFYIDEAVEILSGKSSNSIPLAKQIPLVADVFNKVSQTNVDSVFQRSLLSSDLYQFTLLVFNMTDGVKMPAEQ